MAEDVRVTNMPDINSDSGSPEAVAFKLVESIRIMLYESYKDEESVLDLYARCLDATRGRRKINR